jgi:hypothetical protein
LTDTPRNKRKLIAIVLAILLAVVSVVAVIVIAHVMELGLSLM